ncbi:hypothetical protein [Bacillus toyonensis]|uniref:hypothetical protein n=1 Tax=Bacillus toyonensis TaxID=155322 RepID=UPI0018A1893D|nr:hypothetical protein [Bacillus toyonensis]MBF7150825.1 hypothetical protein [Bacillus toyonensis]MEC2351409.1 hypothetical protein [Bacillus toyonensis]MED3188831.1 hypothetical protein [Bacillus toyonensis]
MNVINIELVRRKKMKNKTMIMIPIIELIFELSGEIQFEVIGEKEVSISWLEKE